MLYLTPRLRHYLKLTQLGTEFALHQETLMLITYIQSGRFEDLKTKLLRQVATKSMQSLLMYYRDEMIQEEGDERGEEGEGSNGLITLI